MSLNMSFRNYTIDHPMDALDVDFHEPPNENHTLTFKPTPSCLRFQFFCSLLMSTLCLVGIIGNLLSFWIFTRRCMRSSINILLAGLSLVDTSVLAIAVPVFVVPGLNCCDLFGSLEGLHVAIVFGLYQLGMMAQTCSVYTFVLISIERYLAVVHPLHVQQFLTVRRAKFAQFALLAFAVIYNLARFWEYELVYDDYDYHVDDDPTEGAAPKHNAPLKYTRLLRANEVYFLGYYTVSFVVVHFLIPFSLITILNAKIVKSIIHAGRVRSSMTPRVLNGTESNQRKERKISRMIVLVTAFFIFCNFLPFVLNVWEAVMPSLFESGQSQVAYFTLDVSNLLVTMNSSLNFVIYLIYCRQYRRMLLRYLHRRGWNGRRRNTADITDSEAVRPSGRTGIGRYVTLPLVSVCTHNGADTTPRPRIRSAENRMALTNLTPLLNGEDKDDFSKGIMEEEQT